MKKLKKEILLRMREEKKKAEKEAPTQHMGGGKSSVAREVIKKPSFRDDLKNLHKAERERLQLASFKFLKEGTALDYTKDMDIEKLRYTGRSVMNSFHMHKKMSIKPGFEYEDLKLHMEDFSKQLAKAFSTLETKAAEEPAEPAEQLPDLKVTTQETRAQGLVSLLKILFKAAEESELGEVPEEVQETKTQKAPSVFFQKGSQL